MASKRKTARSPRQVPAKGRAGAVKGARSGKMTAGGRSRGEGEAPAEPRKSRPKAFVGGRGAAEPRKPQPKTSMGGRGAAEPGSRTKRAHAKNPAAPRTERIQLRWIAQARSGDKGDIANVALFAPTPETYVLFVREVTAERVKAHFGNYVKGRVDRYEAPNVRALNFVCHSALGGGAAASLRSDPLGKSYGSNLLRMEIDIPSDVLKRTPKLVAPKELPEG